MRPVYTAVNEAAARAALDDLRRDFGKKSPGLVAAWERSGTSSSRSCSSTPPSARSSTRPTPSSPSTSGLRKIIKNRGHFPDVGGAIKLLYLGIRNITGRHIDGDGRIRERGERGTGSYGWKAAINALAVHFGDRVPI